MATCKRCKNPAPKCPFCESKDLKCIDSDDSNADCRWKCKDCGEEFDAPKETKWLTI